MQKSNRFFFGIAFATIVFVGGMTAFLVDIFLNAPDFTLLKTGAVKMVVYNAKKEKVGFREVGPKAPGWVPVTQVSQNLLTAVVSSEDTSFFSHEGIDFHELKLAIKKDLEERRFARGGSTITQQVVKNVYLDRSKTVWRKVREFVWAREMDKVLSKSEILGVYVNAVEWGPNIYGIRDAARHYFGTTPGALTAKQGAFLAMLLPSPVKYHQYYVSKELTVWAAKRVRQVLKVMLSMKFIDFPTYEVALNEPLWDSAVEPPLSQGDLAPAPGDLNIPADEDPEIREPAEPPITRARPEVVREGKGTTPIMESAPEPPADGAGDAPPPEPDVIPQDLTIE